MIKLTLVFMLVSLVLWLKLNLIDQGPPIPAERHIRIYKDEVGVSRIYGYNKKDILFGLGYSAAHDRLWTLTTRKFLVQGRMSELFGRLALESDIYMRNIDFLGVGRMNAKNSDPQARQLLQQYLNGINYYAKTTKLLPLGYYLFWIYYEEFKVEDTLAIFTFISFALEFDWMHQIARERLLQTSTFGLALRVFSYGTVNQFRNITILNDQQLKSNSLYEPYSQNQIEILFQLWGNKHHPIGKIGLTNPSMKFMPEGSGSNAWVVSGNHTKNGKPLLSNDPHFGLILPGFIYLFELNLLDENNNTIISSFGGGIDGVPGLSIGMNNDFAWGSTASYVDNKDIFYQTVRSMNGTDEYLTQNGWRNFTLRQQTFKIRGQSSIIYNYKQTHRGPVLECIFHELFYKYGYPFAQQYEENHTISLDATIYRQDNISLFSLINLGFERNKDKVNELRANMIFPNIDSVWIDLDGNWGYYAVGGIPKRNVPQMGGFMKDGTNQTLRMGEFLPYEQLPRMINSMRGYIGMANNKFASDNYKHRSSIHQLTTGRSYRIDKILSDHIKNGSKFDHEFMMKMHFDTKDQFLSQAFPNVLQALKRVSYIWQDKQTIKMYNLLKQWDYFVRAESIEAGLFHVWQREFHSLLLLQLDLDDDEREAIRNHAFFQPYLLRMYEQSKYNNYTNQEHIICNNRFSDNYTNVHPCIVNMAIAMKNLPNKLQELYNSNKIQDYRWGHIHKTKFRSIPYSDIPLLNLVYERSIQADGNSRTINVGIFTSQTNSYNKIAGATFRFITDLETTYFMLDSGQSDSPFSSFYDNFIHQNQYVQYRRCNVLQDQVPKRWTLFVDSL